MTVSQRRALAAHWHRFGIDDRDDLLDFDAVFGRSAPRRVEVGFGMGDALLEMALADPARDYLGIEVYEPGIGRLLARLHALGVANARIIRADAVDVFSRLIPDASLEGVMIFFPDPWPKKRHHKRRLVQPGFVEIVCAKLQPGARLELATDWEDYAVHMLAVADAQPRLTNLAGAGRFAPRPAARPATKFERRGRRLGHGVYDLVLERIGDRPAEI